MTTKGKIISTLLIILVIAALIGAYLTFGCYSSGKRAGNVIKFSHKGMIFKTWEGEMIQRNFSVAPGDTWKFSVSDENVVNQINDAMSHGQTVDLQYCEKYYKFFWQGETSYFITNAAVVQQ
jgi:hypothetical protein